MMNGMNQHSYQNNMNLGNSYQMNQRMGNFNFNNYQGIMNLEMQSNMQQNQRINGLQMRPNMSRPDMINMGIHAPNQAFEYESENSNEESKENYKKQNDDELFLHPYSSIIRKEASNTQSQANMELSRSKPLNMTFKSNDTL